MQSRSGLAVLVALVACGHSPPSRSLGAPQAPSAAVPAPLARFRATTGGERWDAVQVIASRGTLELGGMTGPVETREDVPTGRWRNDATLGGHRFRDGFDGAAAWTQDPGGEVVAPDAPEAVAQARTRVWLVRRGYFRAAGAAYRALGDGTAGGRPYQRIEATPDGGVPIALWIDASTGLLARTEHREGRDTVVTTLEDYRDAGGVRVPFRVAVERGGDAAHRVVMTLASAALEGAAPEATWTRPATDGDRIAFVGAEPRTVVPFDLVNNHIYVNGAVDGKPVRLLVDTGGVNLLTPQAVARLGLRADGNLPGGGVGAKKVDVGLARGARLRVGEVELKDPVFYVIDFDALADVEGEDIDGLVGFEMFHRLAVRIDYPARRLALSRPEGFAPPAGAVRVPFELRERTPIVAGSIDGVAARFVVDTGSRVSLTAHAPFVRANDLQARYRPRFETITGWGVGGPLRSWPVRFGEVAIGGVTVRRVAGDLFTGDTGAFASPDAAANLGGGVLRRFVVTFDYRGQAMYLEPGPAVDAPDVYDRSGLFLLRDGDGLKVAAVTPGSPAAKAGLTTDDRIVAIDRAPATSRHLSEWRGALRDRDVGTRVTLTLERGGARRDVALVLEELLP